MVRLHYGKETNGTVNKLPTLAMNENGLNAVGLQYINKITMSVCLSVCLFAYIFSALRLGRYKSRTKKDFGVRFFLNSR